MGEIEKLSDSAHWGYCMAKATGEGDKPGNYCTDIRSYWGWINSTISD